MATISIAVRSAARLPVLCDQSAVTMPDIRPVHVEVLGVHRLYTRLLIVEISVEPEPPRRWAEAFNTFVGSRGEPPEFTPKLDGSCINVTPPDHELELWVQAVERRIRHVNKKMQEELQSLTPQPQRAARLSQAIAQEGFSPDVLARIMEARRMAAGLSGVFQSSSWEAVDVTALDRAPTRDTMVDLGPPPSMVVASRQPTAAIPAAKA